MKQIALRIRDLREISDRSVEQMAEALGVSVTDYVAYESGVIDIPISFLLSLSAHFDVDMTEILTGNSPRLNVYALTRKNMGVDIERHEHYRYKNLAYNFAHRKIEPLLVKVEPGVNQKLQPNSHSGHEFDYMLEGILRIVIGGHEVILNPGDSIYYDSIYPHAMQAVGDKTATFLAMVIP